LAGGKRESVRLRLTDERPIVGSRLTIANGSLGSEDQLSANFLPGCAGVNDCHIANFVD